MRMDEVQKINLIISEHRIKLHRFNPSKREIWCVVGNKNEYWFDQSLDFCSCKGYYFTRFNKNDLCYHLKSAKAAKIKDVDIIEFSDDEYDDFLLSIINGLFDQ